MLSTDQGPVGAAQLSQELGEPPERNLLRVLGAGGTCTGGWGPGAGQGAEAGEIGATGQGCGAGEETGGKDAWGQSSGLGPGPRS